MHTHSGSMKFIELLKSNIMKLKTGLQNFAKEKFALAKFEV
jgi:hypothetical protein